MLCLECGSENPKTNSFCGVCGMRLKRPLDLAARPAALIGEVLDGKYRVDALMGSGSASVTYRAERLLVGDLIALKILLTDEALDQAADSRLRHAATVATRVRHPNSAAVFDAGVARSHNLAFISMELAAGRRLDEFLREGELSTDQMFDVAGAICGVLDEAHRLGIFHGDIRPKNILIDERSVTLLDLGVVHIAEQVGGRTEPSSAYRSPEQAAGRQPDAGADIYSLGMVLYETLCGTVPFRSIPASVAAGAHVQPPPLRLFNPDIPAALESVILSAVALDPAMRFRTAGEFFDELSRAAGRSVPVPGGNGTGITSSAKPQQILRLQPLTGEAEILEIGGIEDPAAVQEDLLEVFGPGIPVEAIDRIEAVGLEDERAVPRPSAPLEPTENVEPSRPGRMVPRFVPEASEVPEAASSFEPAPASQRGKLFYASIAMLVAIAFLAGILAGLRFFSTEPAEPRTERPTAEPAPPQTGPAKSDPTVPPAGMAYVPGGEFMMGSDLGDPYSRPAHPVNVGAFFIDLTEVTNEAYKKFVDATGHQPPSTWASSTFPEGESLMPVTGVNWKDANAYAKWAGKRLPTEAEWEYAARGTDGRIYPWGDKWIAGYANAGIKATGFREVGSGGRSPFGLYDMAGNAWEWTSTDAAAYPGGKAFEASDRSPKIIRGGSWKSRWTEATAVNRAQWGAEGESDYSYSGFRCARDIIVE